MPKIQTEYMRNFKWTDRPIRFKPPTASLDPKRAVCEPRRAGLASSVVGIHREPMIHTKNRSASPNPPPASVEPRHRSSSQHHLRHSSDSKAGLSLSHSGALPFSDPLYRPVPPLITSARSDDAPPAGKPTWKRADPQAVVAEDYILLGNQSKFANNVAYRLRKPIDPNRISQLPPQPPKAQLVEEVTQTSPPQVAISSPPVPRFYTADENIQVGEAEIPKEALTPPPSPPDAPRPEPAVAVQTEPVSTDEHYAIRQRLGLVSRVNAGRFQTEYSRSFSGKHPVSAPILRKPKIPESPLMNAEVMFRRSRSRSPVAAADVMPKSLFQTEYDRSFKPYQWQLHQQPQRRSISAEGHEILYEAHVPNRSPIPTAEKATALKKEDKGKPEILSKLKTLKLPKRYVSEYSANFKGPSQFKYEDGTWKGVTQPHNVLTQSAPVAPSVAAEDPSWLSEVRELKSRAKEYQLRNKGTHFSASHVAQLYSEKAALWDQNEAETGDGGSRFAMLDVPVPPRRSASAVPVESAPELVEDYVQVNTLPTQEDLMRPAGLATKRRGTVRESLDWAVKSPDSSPIQSEGECASTIESVQQQPEYELVQEEQQQYVEDEPVIVNRLPVAPKTDRSQESNTSSTDSVLPSAAGGRVRTSRLAELQLRGNGSPRRHHLDVTTPAVGGAILVSPPMPITRPKSKSRSASRNHHNDSNRSAPNTAGGVSSGYSSAAPSRPRSPAAYGKPTGDSHLLVERDRPIQFHYVTAPKSKQSTQRTDQAPKTGTIEQLILQRSRENVPTKSHSSRAKISTAPPAYHSSRPQTKESQRSIGLTVSIPETSATYKVSKAGFKTGAKIPQEETVSPPSPASSATYSAASDVLEKAKARAHFWDKTSAVKAT